MVFRLRERFGAVELCRGSRNTEKVAIQIAMVLKPMEKTPEIVFSMFFLRFLEMVIDFSYY